MRHKKKHNPVMLNEVNITPQKQNLFFYIVLILAVFCAYCQVYDSDFVNFDDQTYVTQNRVIQSGISPDGIILTFTTGYFRFRIAEYGTLLKSGDDVLIDQIQA